MNKKEILKNLNIEDYIWLLNFFIVLYALVANQYQRDFVINKNYTSEKVYKTINIGIFIIAFIIYAYYAYTRYIDINTLKNTSSNKEVFIKEINFVASILFVLSTGIYLYTEIIDQNVIDEAVDLF